MPLLGYFRTVLRVTLSFLLWCERTVTFARSWVLDSFDIAFSPTHVPLQPLNVAPTEAAVSMPARRRTEAFLERRAAHCPASLFAGTGLQLAM